MVSTSGTQSNEQIKSSLINEQSWFSILNSLVGFFSIKFKLHSKYNLSCHILYVPKPFAWWSLDIKFPQFILGFKKMVLKASRETLTLSLTSIFTTSASPSSCSNSPYRSSFSTHILLQYSSSNAASINCCFNTINCCSILSLTQTFHDFGVEAYSVRVNKIFYTLNAKSELAFNE